MFDDPNRPLIDHPPLKTLIVMRHGRSPCDALSVKGSDEITTLAKKLKARLPKIDAVLHSPSGRTTQTAAIIQGTFSAADESKPLILPTPALATSGNGKPIFAERWDCVCLVTHLPIIQALRQRGLVPSDNFAGREGELVIGYYGSWSWDHVSHSTLTSWEIMSGDEKSLVNTPRPKFFIPQRWP